MWRKISALSLAIALSAVAAVAVASPGSATARPATAKPVNASAYAVLCKGVTGTVTFTPPLKTAGTTSGHEADKILVTLRHCKATGKGRSVSIGPSAVTGTLTSNDGSACSGLLLGKPPTGTLTFKWTGTALSSGPSVVHVKSIDGTENGGRAHIVIPGSVKSTATGSFSKSGGSKDAINVTGDTIAGLTTECNSNKGLVHLNLSSGTVALS